MSARLVAAIAVAAATLLGLSACAPAAHPTSSHSPHHGSGGSAPTPSATPVLAPPKVRIPLTCDQLAPSATLASVMGTTMTAAPEFPDPDIEKYAAIQDGALNCNWNGPEVKGNLSANWTILVMPDATSSWNSYKDDLQSPYPAAYLGAGMFGYCNGTVSGDDYEYCTLDTLDGSVWLHVGGVTGAGPLSSSSSVAMTRFRPLLAAAINAIKGITVAEPAWTDPAATAVHVPPKEGVVDQDAFATAIHAPFAIDVSLPDWDLGGPESAEMVPVNFREDAGGGTGDGGTVTPATNYGATLEVLPSGSWAYAQMMAAASGEPGFTQLTGLGTKAYTYNAPGVGADHKEIVLVGIVGEHLYSIDVSSPGTPGTPDLTTMSRAAANYVIAELTP